nr:MAG TPA: hypothetical protein [Caudoviricetes sp.]
MESCKGLFLYSYTTPHISGPCAALYGLIQGFLLCPCWYNLQAARISIKNFLDFEIEIEIDFDRGTIAINQCFFFIFVWLICPNRGGGYTSRSRGGVSAENSDKNKKTFDN